jgi:hypothetical protein
MISSKSKEILFLQKLEREQKLDPVAYQKLLDERYKKIVEDMKAKIAKEREKNLVESGIVLNRLR